MDCMDTCGKKMKSRVFAKLETAANSAADQAVDMVAAWGRRRDEGGLAFQTYRATCVREYVDASVSFRSLMLIVPQWYIQKSQYADGLQ